MDMGMKNAMTYTVLGFLKQDKTITMTHFLPIWQVDWLKDRLVKRAFCSFRGLVDLLDHIFLTLWKGICKRV